jgi:3-deoxy-D-manno-octulosonate 8-phosphate phosphatase (KDO 8-P phosphatase)
MHVPIPTDYSTELLARAKNIKLLMMDVDGVMTDGGLIQGDDGLEYKRFHARDGLGLKLLKSSGVQLAMVTGRTSVVVENRAKEIGVVALEQGCHTKATALEQICKTVGISAAECIFVGDDIIDLPAFALAGLSIAVADAHPLVLANADWVTQKAGGCGAIREVCELIMHAQGTLQTAMEPYLP